MGLKLPGILTVLAIAAPNLLWFAFPPVNIPPEVPGYQVLKIVEGAGRLAIFIVPLFYGFQLKTAADKAYLGGMILSLLLYYAGWLRLFTQGREYALLWEPLGVIPVPLAVAPVLCILCFAGLSRSWPALVSAAVLAVSHIPMSYLEHLRMVGR